MIMTAPLQLPWNSVPARSWKVTTRTVPVLLRSTVKPEQDMGSSATRAPATGVLAAVSVANADARATRARRQLRVMEAMRDPSRASLVVAWREACLKPH